jgi:hypothetical protein
MLKDGEANATRQKVLAWWRDLQARGEKQTLAGAVRKGDRDSLAAAAALVERHPEDALEALRAGLAGAAEEHVRVSLLHFVGRLPGEGPLATLREHLHGGPLRLRAEAAWALLQRGQPDAVPAVIAAWRAIRDPDGGVELIELLAGCGQVEAVRALADGLDGRSPWLRHAVVNLWLWGRRVASEQVPAEVEEASDDLLASRLGDRAVAWGMSGTLLGKSVINPRLCDLAGALLAQRWGRTDLFDLEASRRTRDRQLVEVANVWRGRRGQPPLPLPAPVAHCLPDARAWEVVTAVVAADSADLPPGLLQVFDALPGRVLRADDVLGLFLTALRGLPADAVGAEVSVEREGDGSGAGIELRLLPRRYPPPRERPTWGQNGHITVGGRTTWATSGGSAYRHGLTEECWRDLGEALREALASPPGVSVLVQVHATTEQGGVLIPDD